MWYQMRYLIPLTLLLLSVCPGCSTLATQYWYFDGLRPESSEVRVPLVYGGTIMAIGLLNESSWTEAGMCTPHPLPLIMDLPLSLALDTALLPFTAVEATERKFRNDEELPVER